MDNLKYHVILNNIAQTFAILTDIFKYSPIVNVILVPKTWRRPQKEFATLKIDFAVVGHDMDLLSEPFVDD